MRQPRLNGRQARWCMYLTPFEFVIKHRPGKSNPADGLSRQINPLLGDARGDDLLMPIRDRMVPVSAYTQSVTQTCVTVQNLAAGKTFDVTWEPFSAYASSDPVNLVDASEVDEPDK